MNLNLFKNSLLLAAAVLYSANSFAVGGENQTEMGQFEVTPKSGVKIKKQDRWRLSNESVLPSNLVVVKASPHQEVENREKCINLCQEGKLSEMIQFMDQEGVSVSLKDLNSYYNPVAHHSLLVEQMEQGSVSAARLLFEEHANLYSPSKMSSPGYFEAMNPDSLPYCLLGITFLKAGDLSIFPTFMKFWRVQSYNPVS